ncbi:MAG: methyltransferase domain-containing protein [Chloroflexota bacterium]
MVYLFQQLVRLGFFLLYNQLAFTYDTVAWLVSFGQWADWRRTALQHLIDGSTLELAYGTGGLYVDMRLAGDTPVGIDLSPYMAQLTAQRLQHYQLKGEIMQAKAQALPFPDAYFSNVVATFPTQYIFEAATLTEIYRVLPANSEDGKLIVVMQGQLKEAGWIKHVVEWLYYVTGQRGTIILDPISPLQQAGFEARWETGYYGAARASLIIAQKKQSV